MRLLKTSTLELQDFIGDIPYYAILSHRWEHEEVTFQDFHDGKGPNMVGYSKILKCCEQAVNDGWQYVWIDCCCIDKSSSAELSEAINSMFQWYKDAQVCYAYLSDVEYNPTDGAFQPSFQASKWFTRGWTLQELLAPHAVVFFNQEWEELGTKSTLESWISSITGIKDLIHFDSASIAQKMSWAAGRHTTRVEDKAYCLLGLFGINMPLLYGEGPKAFLRLQLEILNVSDDESIFAWGPTKTDSGLLAPDAIFFKNSGDVRAMEFFRRQPYSMTNKGLSMEICIDQAIHLPSYKPHTTFLNCVRSDDESPLTIQLKPVHGHSWHRPRHDNIGVYQAQAHFTPMSDRPKPTFKIVHIKQQSEVPKVTESPEFVHIPLWHTLEAGFKVLDKQLVSSRESGVAYISGEVWQFNPYHIRLRLKSGNVAGILFSRLSGGLEERFVLILDNYHGRLGIQLKIPEKDAMQDFLLGMLFDYIPSHRPDRACQYWPSGIEISAVVKRQVKRKQLENLVNILVHETNDTRA